LKFTGYEEVIYMRLTRNDRFVLKCLIENGRASDAGIARKLKITLQGVRKIRKKLEDNGVIKGYSTEVDYKKLGINVFAIVMMKAEKNAWKELKDEGLIERMRKNTPHMVCLFRTVENESSSVALYGFRNLEELSNYFHTIDSEFHDYITIKKILTSPTNMMVKKTDKDLLFKIINEMGKYKPAKPVPFGLQEARRVG
jgi:DNA-binding Lrp family transcriptional regulator